jgi:hypothetical protein
LGGHPLHRAGAAAFASAFPEAAIGMNVARELRDAARALYDFTESTLSANKAIAHFSPLMATGFARLQLGDFRRSLGTARDTELTGAALIQSMDRLRDAFYPFQVFGRNVTNEAAGFVAGGIGGGAKELGPLIDIVEGIRKALDAKGDLAEKAGGALARGLVMASGFGPILAAAQAVVDWLDWGGGPPMKLGAWDELLRKPPPPLFPPMAPGGRFAPPKP